MNAETTANRLLAWAMAPRGALPTGPLWDTTALARPGPATLRAASALARQTAGRLGAGTPPFGSKEQIGLGVVLLAAAVGGRDQHEQAVRLADSARQILARRGKENWYDLMARHGLIVPVLDAQGDQPLADDLLDASPLSTVLHRPPARRLKAGTTAQSVGVAVAMLKRPNGTRVLGGTLSGWLPESGVLTWRAELLDRLRHDHLEAVLDVYFAARARHGAEWDKRIRWATRQLGSGNAADPLAIATLRFWAPLAAVAKQGVPLVERRPLMTGHQPAIGLVRRYRMDLTGAA